MTSRSAAYGPAFKRALTVSGVLHAALLGVIIVNPSLPKSSPKGVIHYINLGGGGGGGDSLRAGGSGGAPPQVGTTPLKKETLRDLTTVQKLEARRKAESEFRYPVEKPKKTPKKGPDKKAVVGKPDPNAKTGAAGAPAKSVVAGTAAGTGGTGEGGSGLSFGAPGAGGEGFGPGGDSGLSNFPFTWYLIEMRNKIQMNWFPSVVEIGAGASLMTWVYFRIFRDGSISAVEVKESSGVHAFDNNAIRAIADARPFPPLPREYDGEYLGINLRFEHAR